jgi:hypothetical protein
MVSGNHTHVSDRCPPRLYKRPSFPIFTTAYDEKGAIPARGSEYRSILQDVTAGQLLPDYASFLKNFSGKAEFLLRKYAVVTNGIVEKTGEVWHSPGSC